MARKTVRRTRAQPRRDNTTLIIAGVIAAVVVVVLLIWLSGVLSPGTPAPAVAAAGKTWGQANAPVTIDMWSDFQ